MHHRIVPVALATALLGVGWLLGAHLPDRPSPEYVAALDRDAEELRGEVRRLQRLLGERGPLLEGGPRLTGTDTAAASPTLASAAGPSSALPKTESFDITAFDDPDEAFQALLAYTATRLGKGPDGHLALLETLNATFAEKPGEEVLQNLVGTEEQAIRYLYPILRFAMNHDAQVADMTETIFKTMAENPQRLEKIDHDMLQLFTQGVSFMLPGMVGEERLGEFRAHARKILDAPRESQPRSVQRERRSIQKALESWAPTLSADEALKRLRAGGTSPEEALSLLRRVSAEQIASLDLDALLGPMLQTDGFRVISMIGRLKPDAATMGRLDQRVLRGASDGTTPQSLVQYYLRHTGRQAWREARPFLEAGLRQAPRETAGIFLMAALQMRDGPDEEWIAWAERTYEFSDRVRLALKQRKKGR